MPDISSKQELLDKLQGERDAWEALLAEIGAERMELPGVTGDWTMKDTIVHLTTWWRREVARLYYVQRGERPPDHPPQTLVPVINEWIYLTNRDRPLSDVLGDARAAWQQFITAIQAIPEEAWLEKPEWMQGRTMAYGMFEDFTEHLHDEHEPLIHEWLAKV